MHKLKWRPWFAHTLDGKWQQQKLYYFGLCYKGIVQFHFDPVFCIPCLFLMWALIALMLFWYASFKAADFGRISKFYKISFVGYIAIQFQCLVISVCVCVCVQYTLCLYYFTHGVGFNTLKYSHVNAYPTLMCAFRMYTVPLSWASRLWTVHFSSISCTSTLLSLRVYIYSSNCLYIEIEIYVVSSTTLC